MNRPCFKIGRGRAWVGVAFLRPVRCSCTVFLQIFSEIERLEAENTALDEAIADPANATNSAKLQELSIQRGENDAKLEELLEHWEELSE